MGHLPTLVSDLALILITAGIVTIIFKWLKQPVVLGYIVAGFLISPHFILLPSVADPDNINTWAEIGVVFLLFALGLEFSFKKLMRVGGQATIATLINMGSMIAIGYLIGQAMGWTNIECLFLGGMLSMSSTTIIIKAFNDMGLQREKFANMVFGMLIVEDLAAILMMVLLSTVAVSQHFEGMELLEGGLKLIFFMLIWFVVGILLIPTLLKKLKKFLNDETLLVVAVGMCLGMVLFADAVGFSAALGAFIMGSILAETMESRRIEHLVEPLKNLFGAVFFVSVGMLITPWVVVDYIWPILLLTAVVLVGRVIFASVGVIAAGQGVRVAIRSGFSLAQIGEFSFIIATLGMQLGVLSDFIYPIIVMVSVITTFTTPYFIKASTPLSKWIESRIPQKWGMLLTGYAASAHKNRKTQSEWRRLLKHVMIGVVIYFVVSIAVIWISRRFIVPFVTDRIPGIWGSVAAALVTLVLMAPFMSAIVRRGNHTPESKKLWADSHFNKAAIISLNLFRLLMCAVLIAIVLIPLFPRATGLILTVSTALAIGVALSQGFRKRSDKLELQFMLNLNDKEYEEARKRPLTREAKEELAAKNIHLEEISIAQDSPKVGRTLAELNFRQSTGVQIVCIIRGREKINIPGGDVRIYPFDKMVVAGTDEQVRRFVGIMESKRRERADMPEEVQHHIELSQYEIPEGSPLSGLSIRELHIQRKTRCIVTGIMRGDSVICDFDAGFVMADGDTLLLAGEETYLSSFETNLLK